MQRQKYAWMVVFMLILLVSTTAIASAQQNQGSVRGNVYNDVNADGFCVGTGEAGIAGVTVEFVYQASGTALPLVSGVDGSFGLVNITLGTWEVTVKPPSGWRATSQATRQVTLTADQPVATGIDFCITEGTAPPGGGGTPVLPESGAALAPVLQVTLAAGFFLLVLGAGFLYKGRRSRG